MAHELKCSWCKQKFLSERRPKKFKVHHFCGRSCAMKWRWAETDMREVFAEQWTPERRAQAANTMMENRQKPGVERKLQEYLRSDRNPFRNPKQEERDRLHAKLLRNGTYAKNLTGGNGKGLTVPQKMLLDVLPSSWRAEWSVPTAGGVGRDLPHCYKVDIAHPPSKTAVEVDGASHNNPKRRAEDKKRDECLESLGWIVIRVKNKQVLEGCDLMRRKVLRAKRSRSST
jgi:hypothetical protein